MFFCVLFGGVEAGQGRDVSQKNMLGYGGSTFFFWGLLKGDKVSCLFVCLFV